MSKLIKKQEIGTPSTLPHFLFKNDPVGMFCVVDPKYLYQDWKGETPVTADGDPVGLLRDYRRPIEPVKAVMPAISGSQISTPDSAAVSITGDLEIILDLAMEDWTPAYVMLLIAKWQSTGDQRSFYIALDTAGKILFQQSSDGLAASTTFLSTAATSFSAGQRAMVKVTFDSDNGASGRTTTFFTSVDDGDNWDQLGDPVTVAGLSGIFDSTAPLQLGAYLTATSLNMIGSFYKAEIYNGIGGTLVASFDVNDYITGNTLTSSKTGEVWTKAGFCDFCVGETHFYNDASASRPIYRTDGNAHWLEFSGAQFLRAGALNFTGVNEITALAAAYKDSDAATAILVELSGNSPAINGTFNLALPGSDTQRISLLTRSAAGNTSGLTTSDDFLAPMKLTLISEHKTNGTTADEMRSLRVNGANVVLTSSIERLPGSGNFARHVPYLGARAGTSLFWTGKLYSIAMLGAHFDSDEIAAAETWLESASASLIDNPSAWLDSAEPVKVGSTHYRTSAFAQLQYETEATQMTVSTWNDLHSTYPSFTRIGVYVDGVYNQSIIPGKSGAAETTITLPAGNKVVSLVNGPQTWPNTSNPPRGTYVTRVIAADGTLKLNPAPVNRLVIYGDSISVGDAASPVMEKAWAMQVRAAAYPKSVCVEGWGSRTLHGDCSDSTKRAAFVAKIASYNADKFWMAIGTNDYALNRWNAAAFGAAYAAVLDDLHAAQPDLQIYCQTPLVRVSEAANSLGSTLPEYRTQIINAVASRTSFCTLVDGTAILEVSDLADNVHPTTAGHTKYADYVIAYLGY